MAEGGAELHAKKRQEIYERCQTILFNGAYALHGYAVRYNRVHRKDAKGILDNWQAMDLRAAWLDR